LAIDLARVEIKGDRLRAFRALLMPAILFLLVLGAYFTVFAWRARQPDGAIAFAVLGTSNTPGNRGYDGQYYYRIAVAPLGGRRGLDRPAYRYQRIGYPLLARAVALGDRRRVPDTLVLVNVAAIALGTCFVALLLRRNGLSILYAVPYALYAGQVAAFWRDLAEPLAYALVAAALLAWRVARLWPACLLLLAATLTKEAAMLFTAAACGHLLLCKRWRALGTTAALAVLPYALWQIVLWRIFGQAGMAGTDRPPSLPFGGLDGARTVQQILYALSTVAIPAVLCLGLALHSWRVLWRDSGKAGRRALGARVRVALRVAGDFPTLALLANVALVLWLPSRSYADLWASARNAQGMVLAALAIPALGTTRLRYPLALLWSCGAPLLWLQ
jgi:hypothetical protein